MFAQLFASNDITLTVLQWSLLAVLTLLICTVLGVFLMRLRNNRIEKLMGEYVSVFEGLANQDYSSSEKTSTIQTILPRRAFPLFERFLRKQAVINSDSAENSYLRVAELSGFLKQYRRTAAVSNGWKQAMALRMLTYLPNSADISLYNDVIDRKTFYPSLYCAAIGLAHCKDVGSFSRNIKKLCAVKADNRDDVLTILAAFGVCICPVVLTCLVEFSPSTQTVCIDFLRLHRYMSARKTLEEFALNTKNLEVRIHAIEALGTCGNSDSLTIVEPFLKNEDFRIRIKTVVTLSQIGGREYLPLLLPMLEDPDWWVRRNTAEAIYAQSDEGVAKLESFVHEVNTARGRMARMVIAEWTHGRKRWRYRFAESFS
ncbi:MAG: HEAT repeat domain-containing protein [Fibrobacterota bacterium]|nr:HEAT repeat domain-containing protein [Chitinispirillaceae bacterium]